MMLVTYLNLVPRLRMSGDMLLLHNTPLACMWSTSPIYSNVFHALRYNSVIKDKNTIAWKIFVLSPVKSGAFVTDV